MFSSHTTTTCRTKNTNSVSNKENTSGSSNCNTLNNARAYIHEVFKTAEQRQADKSVTDQIQDAVHHMPSIAEDAVESVSDTLSSGLESVEYKLHLRLNGNNSLDKEDKPSSAEEAAALSVSDSMNSGFYPEFYRSVEDLSQVWPIDSSKSNNLTEREEDDTGFVSDSVDATKDVFGSVRANIYDATKSSDEKETEQQREKSVKAKFNEAIHLRS